MVSGRMSATSASYTLRVSNVPSGAMKVIAMNAINGSVKPTARSLGESDSVTRCGPASSSGRWRTLSGQPSREALVHVVPVVAPPLPIVM